MKRKRFTEEQIIGVLKEAAAGAGPVRTGRVRVRGGRISAAVLTAFQGVEEDNIAALRIREEEARVQAETVDAAQESVRITTNQHLAGTVPYLNVITAQVILLSDEVTLINLQGRRMAAAVLLIGALGGGWDVANLPSAKAVSNTTPHL